MLAAATNREPRIAVVDLAVAAENMPGKKDVEAHIQAQIEALNREIETRWKEVEKLNEEFDASRKALSAEGQAEYQAKIIHKEKDISEYWAKRSEEIRRSATDGAGAFSELIRLSISDMAGKKGFDLVFDKENGRLLYASDRFDHTRELLEIMERVPKSAEITNPSSLNDSRLERP